AAVERTLSGTGGWCTERSCLTPALRSALALEDHHPQWRQGDDDRLGIPVARHRRRIGASEVALPAAAVDRRVAVQDLAPFAAPGNAESMIVARHGGPVGRDDAGDPASSPA